MSDIFENVRSNASYYQTRFHPIAKDMIKEYIFNELPINLLRLPKMEIYNQWAIWGQVQSTMDKLESLHDVPSRLRDSEKEPDPSDIVAFINDKIKWVIFSHRWGEAEPVYEEVKENKLSDKPGHKKLRNFCEVAHGEHHAEFVWSDTCCINKKDSTEYARSIRSMYRWYANAPLCVAYLVGTINISDLERDVWFTRGWTLQELLAPKKLKFYNKNWHPLTNIGNDKESPEIAAQIERATTISPDDLRHFSPADRLTQKYEISKRMRWAALRETTVAEDRAYSLMGIFSVSLYIDPGEGQERALWRLMEQILQFSNSPEVLNWAGNPARETSLSSSAFPSRVACFSGSNDAGTIHRYDEELSMTPRGLRVDLLVLTAKLLSQDDDAPALQALGCRLVSPEVLGSRDGGQLQDDGFQYAFGVWNFNSFQGRCDTTSNDPLEALLLGRQIDPSSGHPKTEWAKVCTKRFVRLEGVEKQKWEAFREKVWV